MPKKDPENPKKREAWGSRIGIIMAVAGSAVGLGNFLRFPVQAASNGGAVFLIPYFISLFLLGIPLMWIEWTAGRFGGGYEHSTAPGIFHTMWQKNRFIKYFGVIGIFGPLVIFIYYTYIESWLLGYAFYALTGKLHTVTSQADMQTFLKGYQGLEQNKYFNGLKPAYIFFLITFIANTTVVYFGIRKGIERLTKIAMPLLLCFAIIIAIRVLTLGAIANPSWTPINGLGFLWNLDLSGLKSAKVWLAAAGQVFFTLSVGIGVILTYASYLKKRDDVALSGLTAVSVNEFVEVILGASIVIPAAFVFFGPSGIESVATSGAFNLGFVTMPLIFQKIIGGGILMIMWFSLLFLAGITSSVSLAQPAIAFLEDEFNLNRKRAVLIFGIVCFILCQPVIFFLGNGVMDEMDFWGGTFCLVVFATIETILFTWVFGIDKAWEELHIGADIKIPKFYKFITKYITPVALLTILGFWFFQQWLPTIRMDGVSEGNRLYVLATRIGLLFVIILLGILVKIAWRKRRMSTYH